MKKVFSLALVSLMLILWACGSKKSPTGGKVDLEKPVLSSSLPAEFSDINHKVLELTFSKYLDKSSVSSGLYIYPLIQNKKVSVDRNKITIRISEDLLPDTNYFITLTTRIKDSRGNALAENQTLVYASGALQRNRLSGVINYEDEKDRVYPLQFNLFSADSLQILSRQIVGGAFALDTLNPVPHIYTAYIDKNANGRYDLDTEPRADGRIEVKGIASIDLNMSYVDTVLAKVSSVQPVSSRELLVTFSEPVLSISEVRIIRAGSENIPVMAQFLDGKSLTLITSEQARTEYQIVLTGLTDRKGNISKVLRFTYWGSSSPDIREPAIVSSNPRNGTSVNSTRPELTLSFSELIDPGTVKLNLKAAENGQNLDFDILSSNPNQVRIRPRTNLPANRSYQLILNSSLADYSGNKIKEGYTLNFLILSQQ